MTSVIEDNIELRDFTLVPNAKANKAIEVLGKDVEIQNINIAPNSITPNFSGSLFFNGDVGNAVVDKEYSRVVTT